MKKLILVAGLAWLFLLSPVVSYSDNIEAVLDSQDGSSSLSVKDSGNTEVAHIDSDGNIQTDGSLGIDGTGDSYIMGNVGIGTTSPSQPLEIWKSDSGVADVLNLHSGDTASEGNGPALLFTARHGGSNWATAKILGADQGGYLGQLWFYTQDTYKGTSADMTTPKMVIKSNGNVGIGTTAPTHKFVIEQTSNADVWQKIKGFDGRIAGIMIGETEGTGGVINRGFDIYQDGSSNTFRIDRHDNADAGTNVLTINRSNGNVGIGTTSPMAALHIVGKDAGVAVGNEGFRLTPYATLTGNDPMLAIGTDDAASGKGYVWIRSLSQDGSTGADLALMPSNGNVGIGTTSPSGKLHVYSDSASSDVELYVEGKGTGNNINRVVFKNDVADIATVGLGGSGLTAWEARALVLAAPSGQNIVFSNGTSEKARIDSNGNVGIGTDNPAYKLHIVDSNEHPVLVETSNASYGSIDLKLSNTSSTFGQFSVWDSNNAGVGNIRFANIDHTANTADLQFMLRPTSGGWEKMTIRPDGNVGIGTTSPGEKLEVDGAIKLGTTSNTNAGTIRWTGTDFEGYDGSSWVSLTSGGGGSSLWTDGGTYIYPTDAGSSAMVVTDAGNVGIGTTSPSELLHIYSTTADAEIRVESTASGMGGKIRLIGNADDIGGVYFGDSTSDTLGRIWYYGSSHATRALDMDFFTNDSVRMTIDSSGNVGIGTTSPGAKLSVVDGKVFMGGSAEFTDGTVNIRPLAVGVVGLVLGEYSGQTADVLEVKTSSGTVLDVIDKDGNVGIGTTSPNLPLHIHSDKAFLQLTDPDIGAAATDGFVLGIDSNGDAYVQNRENGRLEFRTNNTERMRITNAGNVGIGTTNPQGTLHLSGVRGGRRLQLDNTTTPSSDYGSQLWFTTQNNARFVIGLNPNDDLYIDRHDGSNFHPDTMVIQRSTGNIGIGTTSPAEKLEVDGSIRLSGGINWEGNDLYLVSYQDVIPRVTLRGTASYGAEFYMNNAGNTETRVFLSARGGDSYISTGNVGIGTTSPGAKLHVSGGDILVDNNKGLMVKNSVGSNGYVIYRGSDDKTYIGQSGWDGDTVFLQNGNVGIGTTNPVAQLEIKGAGGTTNQLRVSNVTTGYGVDISAQSTGGLINVRNSAGTSVINIDAQTNANSFFNAGGNVGIGTTSPTAKLDVNGSTGYNQLRMRTTYTPTSTSDTNGNTGDVAWDDNYIYIKTSAGWKRAALSTF